MSGINKVRNKHAFIPDIAMSGSKRIQKRISVNHEGLSTPITT